MASFVLYFLPMVPFIISIFSMSISVIYKVYALNAKSIDYNTKSIVVAFYKMQAVTFLFLVTIIVFLKNDISEVIRFEVTFFICLCLITNKYLASYSKNDNSIDLPIFSSFITLFGVMLLTSSDMISIFFILEMINCLIIYIFFSSGILNVSSRVNEVTFKIGSSCVYQIILNFFSSIILYSTILSFISNIGGSSILLIKYSNYVFTGNNINSFIFLSFIIKLGTGPWIFYKINVYSTLNFVSAVWYSIIYGCVVLVLLFNLITIYGLSLSLFYKNVLVFSIALASIYFSGVAFQNQNIFVFLSFSTLLNFSTFIMQIMSF